MRSDFLKTYQMIEKYETADPNELVFKEKMLEFISACDDCFLRSCAVGHFTSSAFLLNKDKSHVCLMHHAKLNKWMQLGGHCDGDWDILNVAIKEAREESGIKNIKPIKYDIFDIDIHLIPPSSKDHAHYHFDVRFLLHACDDDTLIRNHESNELKWVKKASQDIPLNVVRMFKKLEELSF